MAVFRSIEHSFRAATLAFITLLGAESAEAQCVPERESYFVMDARTGEVLLEKDAGIRVQPASMAKLMTLLLAQEAIDKGLMSVDDRVVIASNTSLRADMERLSGWRGSVRLGDAMKGAAISSFNDLAATIAEYTAKAFKAGRTEIEFVTLMNRRAQELGMGDTQFYNASGLPRRLVRVQAGGSTTRDLAILLKHISDHHPALAELLGTGEAKVRGQSLKNTNTLLHNVSLAYQNIFGKTGYTCDAGYALTAHVQQGERRVIASYVGGKDAKEREKAFVAILDQAFAVLIPKKPEGEARIHQADLREPEEIVCPAEAPDGLECVR